LLTIFEDESFKKGVVGVQATSKLALGAKAWHGLHVRPRPQSSSKAIFLKFSDQKEDLRYSFYFLNVPKIHYFVEESY